VGEIGGKHAPVVIPVFLDDPEYERRRLMTLLGGVDPSDCSFDRVHPC
jgi:hypothetical protein